MKSKFLSSENPLPRHHLDLAQEGRRDRLRGEVLFTLETDKVSTEVNSPESGVLKTQAAEGDEVKIGQVVALIEAGGAAPAPKEEAPKAAAPKAEPAPVKEEAAPAPAPKAAEPAKPAPAPKPAAKPAAPVSEDGRTTRKKLTPLRRKIATQLVNAQHTAAILTTFNECDMSTVMSLRKAMQDEFVKKHGIKLGFMSFFVKAVVDALKATPAINSAWMAMN